MAVVLGAVSAALAAKFPSHPWRVIVVGVVAWGLFAVLLGLRRYWKELNNVFDRQESYIEQLRSDLKSCEGDEGYAVGIAREHHRQAIAQMHNMYEKAGRHFERELWQRDAQIEQLKAEIAGQLEFIRQLQERTP